MAGAPVGANVGIAPYDWHRDGPAPNVGDYLCTPAGSAYLIVSARETRRPGRWAYRCVKIGTNGRADIPADVKVGVLCWSRRGRRRPR